MGDKTTPEEKQKIVVGSPLPFSVFGAEGQLLLAEGAVVETDHTRRMLLLKGVYHDSIEAMRTTAPGSSAYMIEASSSPRRAVPTAHW